MKYFIILLLVIFDQFTKYIFYDKNLLINFFLFSKHVFNTWISWWISFFPFDIIKFFTFITLFLIFFLYKKWYIWKVEFILICAWWIWNLIDRVFLWWVRDFITVFDFFPTFNLADIYITFWFIIILLNSIKN